MYPNRNGLWADSEQINAMGRQVIVRYKLNNLKLIQMNNPEKEAA